MNARQFNVTGMSCAACSARVEKAVSALDGVESCSVNLLLGSMSAVGTASDDEIIAAVARAGYGASLKSHKKSDTPKNSMESKENLSKSHIFARLIASIALLIPLMYVSMGHVMLAAPLPSVIAQNPLMIGLIQLVLSGVILVINQKFFINGWRGVISLSPNMDTLVALGSGASFIYSTAVLFLMSAEYAAGDISAASHYLHELYFESAAMILTLITLGKLLEERAKGKTADAIKGLMDLSPKTARVIRDGEEIEIPSADVRVGDVFVLRPGDSVPVDGEVIEGASSLNEAALTGESVPQDKEIGDKVLAATVNGTGYLKCRAVKVGEDTTIAEVIRMVEDAQTSKAPIAKIADKISGVFVPAVMVIALLSFGLWWIFGGEFGYALARGISVLVISCPCALGLATPVAIMVGSGVGAKLGILYKSAEALELAGRAKIVALDKTGTITSGEPTVTDTIPADGVGESELLMTAASVESMSEHPLARAIVKYAEGRVEYKTADDFEALTGSGVRAVLDGDAVYGGSFKFISSITEISEDAKANYERLSGEGKTPIFFTRCGEVIGTVAIADKVREDSREAISALHDMGMKVVMITGDNARTARAIAAGVGIDEVISDVLPDGKEECVRALSEQGGVIMVGDGINDAPALTRADVGIAIGGGTDIAIDSADVVLMRDSLSDVPKAVKLGRAVLRNIRQNLFWAFIYNALGIPLAAGAFIALLGWEMDPMFGAAAMSLSSFSVVMNALRLNTFYKKHRTGALKDDKKGEKNEMITIKVKGMMCPHCEARVKDALLALECVKSADVSHKKGTATVELVGECDPETLCLAIEAQGYKASIK